MRVSKPLLIACGLAAGLFAFAFSVHLKRVDAAWAEMAKEAEEHAEAYQARDHRRPVLWGDATEGNAWVDYDRALSAVRTVGDVAERRLLWMTARREGEFEQAQQLRDAMVDDCRGALDAMSAGAHRETSQRAIDWKAGFQGLGNRATNLLAARNLANVATLAAIRLAEEGDPRGALRMHLDVLQFGHDLTHSPVLIDAMIGSAVIGIGANELPFGYGVLDQVPPRMLEEWRDALARLDESWRYGGDHVRSEATLFANSVQGDSNEILSLDAWRYGFSGRLMMVEHYREFVGFGELIDQYANAPWSEARGALEARAVRLSEVGEDGLGAGLDTSWKAVLLAKAKLGILRAAVGYRLDGQVPEVADPFGDHIQHRVEAESVTLWSAGPDGSPVRGQLEVALPVTPAVAPR